MHLGSGDPFSGVYRTYIPTAAKRLNLLLDPTTYKFIKNNLKTNEAFYTANSISEILFWRERRDVLWDVWASYNGGYGYESYKPQQYAKKVYEKFKIINKCKHLFVLSPMDKIDIHTFKLVEEFTGTPANLKYLINFIH